VMRLSGDGVVPAAEQRATGPDVAASPHARVLLATGGQTLSTHPLYLGRLIIGRTAANDLQIESRFVSRHHCQILTTPQSCVIEDLNSTNGIVVHGKRVRYHNLNDGDVVTIGQHELLYVDERPQLRSSPEEPHSATTVLSEEREQPLETGS
jgi:pSer/pThr/pTyr-binding forkhead associated (FHA) protein